MAKRTIRRRMRKNRTIRKVMRGCHRRRAKTGGQQAKIEAAQYSGASPEANANLAGGISNLAQAQQAAGNSPPPPPPPTKSNIYVPANTQRGGARTRHHRRRLRYKKSMARKSRHA